MSYDSTILADSPVSYWPLNETSGTTATDSADANNGAYNGGFTLNQGAPSSLVDNSVLFNGTNGYVQVSDATNLHLAAPLSLEIWFKTTSSSTQYIFTKYSTSPFPGFGLSLQTGKPAMWVGDLTNGWATSSTSYADNTWHHFVGTLSGTTVKLYIDSVLIATITRTPSLSNTNVLRISADSTQLTSQLFNGALSSVAIYNTALTSTQVLAHYNASGNPAVRVSQEGLLAVTQGNPAVRISQEGLLVVTQGNPKVRISQEGLLAVVTLVNIVKNSSITTQELIETLYSSQGQSLISQEVIEALYSPGSLRSNITQEVIETLFKVSTGRLILVSMDGLNRNANFSGGMN